MTNTAPPVSAAARGTTTASASALTRKQGVAKALLWVSLILAGLTLIVVTATALWGGDSSHDLRHVPQYVFHAGSYVVFLPPLLGLLALIFALIAPRRRRLIRLCGVGLALSIIAGVGTIYAASRIDLPCTCTPPYIAPSSSPGPSTR